MDELKKYVEGELAHGISLEKIREDLIKQGGWSNEDIDAVATTLHVPVGESIQHDDIRKTNQTQKPVGNNNVIAMAVLGFLLILILVVAFVISSKEKDISSTESTEQVAQDTPFEEASEDIESREEEIVSYSEDYGYIIDEEQKFYLRVPRMINGKELFILDKMDPLAVGQRANAEECKRVIFYGIPDDYVDDRGKYTGGFVCVRGWTKELYENFERYTLAESDFNPETFERDGWSGVSYQIDSSSNRTFVISYAHNESVIVGNFELYGDSQIEDSMLSFSTVIPNGAQINTLKKESSLSEEEVVLYDVEIDTDTDIMFKTTSVFKGPIERPANLSGLIDGTIGQGGRCNDGLGPQYRIGDDGVYYLDGEKISYNFKQEEWLIPDGNLIPSADTATFEVIENGCFTHEYAKDMNNVYYKNTKIDGADPETFEVLWEQISEGCTLGKPYAKDDTNVFFFSEKVDSADPSTLEVYINGYATDENSVFKDGIVVTDMNLDLFEDSECTYG